MTYNEMTNEQLNKLVAKNVMGWNYLEVPNVITGEYDKGFLQNGKWMYVANAWQSSTNISQALEVVEVVFCY